MMEFSEAIGLDVGSKRIGVARVGSIARLPEPVCTLQNNEDFVSELKNIIAEHGSDIIVIGLPRNLSSDDTEQTKYTRRFAEDLKLKLDQSGCNVNIEFQDEAGSSKLAQDMIARQVYKNNAHGNPVSIDEVAACIILNDYIGEVN